MYKALIVDDERILRSGLVGLPVWKELGVEALQAANGMQALELLEQEKIHILVTDIRMPGISGLSLIEQAVRRYPWLQVAVLSGYGQFEYAQAALRFGVQDYLLKPIVQKEFSAMIQKMVDRLDRQAMQRRRAPEPPAGPGGSQLEETALCRFLQAGQAQPLPRWVQGEASVELLMIRLEEADGDRAPALAQLLNSAFRQEGLLAALPMERQVAAVFAKRAPGPERLADFLRGSSRSVSVAAERLCVCRAGPCPAGELPQAYRSIQERWPWRFYHQGLADLGSAGREEPPCPEPEALLEALEQKNAAEAQQALAQFCDRVCILEPPPDGTRQVCARLYQSIARQAGPNEQAMSDHICQLMGHSALRFEALRRMLTQLLGYLEKAWSDQELTGYSPPIRQSIRYMQQNLQDPQLSLSYLAAQVLFLHPDYLGRLFRKETGLPFTQYLLTMRMNRAKQLLEQAPELRIGQLCEEVGYGENPRYFSHLFHQSFGCSPSEYRRMLRQ